MASPSNSPARLMSDNKDAAISARVARGECVVFVRGFSLHRQVKPELVFHLVPTQSSRRPLCT